MIKGHFHVNVHHNMLLDYRAFSKECIISWNKRIFVDMFQIGINTPCSIDIRKPRRSFNLIRNFATILWTILHMLIGQWSLILIGFFFFGINVMHVLFYNVGIIEWAKEY